LLRFSKKSALRQSIYNAMSLDRDTRIDDNATYGVSQADHGVK